MFYNNYMNINMKQYIRIDISVNN